MRAVLLVSHGSHSPQTKQEVSVLVERLQKKSAIPIFKFAFLEIEQPSIPEGIRHCAEAGADEVLILLNFLNSGKHVDEDIPRIIGDAKRKYPHVLFRVTSPIGQHPKISELFLEFIHA